MMQTVKIFISSRMNGEVDEERRQAIDAIRDAAERFKIDLRPVAFEHQPCPPSTTAGHASLQWVKDSDVLVAIYYRTISPIVIEEFRAANERGMPILTFRKHSETRELHKEELAEHEKLKSFLRQEFKPRGHDPTSSSYVYKTFRGKTLKRLITQSILEYYARKFDFQRVPEKYLLGSPELEKLCMLKEVFVKPHVYRRTAQLLRRKRLVIIAGPPHTGKSALVLFLGNWMKEHGAVRRVLTFPPDGSLSDIKHVTDSVILFDDPFGASRFDLSLRSLAEGFEAIVALSSRNFVIIASRKDVLQEACAVTRLGERSDLGEIVVDLEPEAYTLADRKRMLYRHLAWHKGPRAHRRYVTRHVEEIVGRVNFPHSYQILVQRGLRDASSTRKGIEDVIKDANEIEIVIGKWFASYYRRDQEIFYFLLVVSLFPGTGLQEFSQIHKSVVEQLREARRVTVVSPNVLDLARFVRATVPYVSLGETIDFRHPSYREGIISKVRTEFLGDIEELVPVCERLARECGFPDIILQGLEEIGFMMPDKVIPILRKLLEEDLRGGSALYAIGKVLPDKVLPVLEELARSENWRVSDRAQDLLGEIGKKLPEVVMPIFVRWAESGSSSDSFRGVYCLGKLLTVRFEETLALLKQRARAEDWNVRRAVALSLRSVVHKKPEDILPILNALSNDKEWLVRRAVDIAFRNYYRWLDSKRETRET